MDLTEGRRRNIITVTPEKSIPANHNIVKLFVKYKIRLEAIDPDIHPSPFDDTNFPKLLPLLGEVSTV